jgi:hypothetical protein
MSEGNVAIWAASQPTQHGARDYQNISSTQIYNLHFSLETKEV